MISGAFARLRRKSKDSSTDEVLRRRRRRDHRTTVTRHSLTVGCCGPEITLWLASIVLCPCSRPSHDGIAADLAARYLYRRSHSARNSRSSGDHGGSTSLKLILTQPKNALVKQYQRLFEMESIDLTLAEEALGAIARKAIDRKTGARGLRSIMEGILLDTMFDLPSLEGVEEVVISKEVVEGTARPLYIYGARAGAADASAS